MHVIINFLFVLSFEYRFIENEFDFVGTLKPECN